MSSTILDTSNFRVLFAQADKLLSKVYNYYPAIRTSFDRNISSTLNFYHNYGKDNEQIASHYFNDILNINKQPENDFANRQVIFALSDSYFIACVWYNAFEITYNYKNAKDKQIGQANEQLAKFAKETISRYIKAPLAYKIDDRDIDKEIGMSWLSYEQLVTKSLNSKLNENDYHRLVNIALANKLGLSTIYQDKEHINGLYQANKVKEYRQEKEKTDNR